MRCVDAWKILVDIGAGKEVKASSTDEQELSAMGLIAQIKPNGDGTGSKANAEMDTIRNRLSEIANEKGELNRILGELTSTAPFDSPSTLSRKYPNYAADSKRLEDLELEERGLRTRFVGLVQSSVEKVPRATLNGVAVHLTYRGREIMTVLGQRMTRVGPMDLRDFLTELDSIGGYFDQRSAKARRILEILSPRYKQTDEIHVRLVSVGLSGRQSSPEESAELFTRAYKENASTTYMDVATAMMLAEVITLRARDASEVDALSRQAADLILRPWVEGLVQDDQIRASAIILACGKDVNTMVQKTTEMSSNYTGGSFSAGAVLATAQDSAPANAPPGAGYNPENPKAAVIDRFLQIYSQIHADYGDVTADTMSAALLAASGQPMPAAIDRFGRAFSILDKFNGGSMRVPSAMITILPSEVDESMDNVRMASSSIMKNKLSLGGAENLSLGIKMLVHSAAMASGGGGPAGAVETVIPSVLAITGVTVAAAFAFGATLLAFHEFSLHKIAVQDYVWHPVHTHYVYG